MASNSQCKARLLMSEILAPLNDVLVREVKWLNIPFRDDKSPFRGKPSKELDHAWHELFVNLNVRVSAEDLKKIK